MDILEPYFEGAMETVVLLTKKNGKSTLIAALSLYHLLTTPFANCIIVAAARDQAQLIMDQARPMIRQSPALQKVMKPLRREIISLIDEGRIRVLASDEDTADGQLPSLAIVDELHRHKTANLYGVLHDGLDARQGQMITISTAGASMDTPLGEIRRKAYAMPGFVRDKEKRTSFVRSPDGAFVFFEWCLNSDDDPDDLKLVKIVNPAPWQTIARLKRRKESPSMTPWRWLRFACGIWTEGEEPAVPPELWDPLGFPELAIPDGSQVWLGLALGLKRDSTAVAICHPIEDRIDAKVDILTGNVTYGGIQDHIRALRLRFDVLGMAYVSKGFEHAADELAAEGLNVVYEPLSEQRNEMRSASFWQLLEEGKLHHDGDPVLRAHVMGARVKETGKGWRFDPDTPRPIAGLLALAAGCEMASQAPVGDVMFGFA